MNSDSDFNKLFKRKGCKRPEYVTPVTSILASMETVTHLVYEVRMKLCIFTKEVLNFFQCLKFAFHGKS